MKRVAALMFVALILSIGIVHAGDWRRPWSTEKSAALTRCAKTFEDFQLQALCMDNEVAGYEKMQGSFGLPSEVAAKAKSRCARTFEDFQLQALCMQNEKDGYDKLRRY
jgi:hypothetical protein